MRIFGLYRKCINVTWFVTYLREKPECNIDVCSDLPNAYTQWNRFPWMSCAACVSLPVTGWNDWSYMNCFSFCPFDIALLSRACAAWLDPAVDDKIVMLYYPQCPHTKMSYSKEFSFWVLHRSTHRFTSCEYIKCQRVSSAGIHLCFALLLTFYLPPAVPQSEHFHAAFDTTHNRLSCWGLCLFLRVCSVNHTILLIIPKKLLSLPSS